MIITSKLSRYLHRIGSVVFMRIGATEKPFIQTPQQASLIHISLCRKRGIANVHHLTCRKCLHDYFLTADLCIDSGGWSFRGKRTHRLSIGQIRGVEEHTIRQDDDHQDCEQRERKKNSDCDT
jgi:hypothetical protein